MGTCRPPHMNPLTGGYAEGLGYSHSLLEIAGWRIPNRKCEGYEKMNRNAELGYDGRWDRSNVNVRQLSSQINGLPQATRGDRQPTGQQPKSLEPEAAPFTHDCAPDPDKEGSARNALAHPRSFRGVFPTRGSVDAPSRTPTSIAFPASRPEPALNSNCSLVRSCRGVISPVSALELPARDLRYQTQSPVHPRDSGKGAGRRRTRRGYQG